MGPGEEEWDIWRDHWKCGCADEPWVPDGKPCPECGYDPEDDY